MTEPTGYTAVGMVGFTDKGTYSASASYVKNDLVHYGGSIWCCLIDDTTGITPTEGTNWTLFVGEPTNMAERIIAPLEVNPSENAYSVGEQLIFNDVLYKAKTAIAVGDALVVDTNIELAPKVTSQIQTLTNETSDIVNVLGAKNLLPNNATTQIINSVQFTVNANGSVGVNRVGTSSSNATIDICSSLVISTPSILSGCPVGGGLNKHALIATDGTNYYSDTGNGVEIPTGTYRVYILIYSSSTISNKTFYPMIRPSSIVDDTYVPYAMTNRELTEKLLPLKMKTITVTTDSNGQINITNIVSDITKVLSIFVLYGYSAFAVRAGGNLIRIYQGNNVSATSDTFKYLANTEVVLNILYMK